MSHNVWKLEFYREDQCRDYCDAYNTGALRSYPLDDGPSLPLEESSPFDHGQLADLVDVITMATDMMEHEAKILFFLSKDGVVVARYPEPIPVGLRRPWKWIQPKDLNDLIARLHQAADLAVHERERENLCQVAADHLAKLRPIPTALQAEVAAKILRSDEVSDPLRARLERLCG